MKKNLRNGVSLHTFGAGSLLCLVASVSAFAASDLVRLPEFNCRGDADTCFAAARSALQSSADDQDALLKRRTPEQNEVLIRQVNFGNATAGRRSEYSIGASRTPVVFVFIHGLYGAPAQFERQADYAASFGMNSLTLTLAGHGDQLKQARQVRYDDWIEETRRAVKLARALGDRVVVVGQSTGGALAVIQALSDPLSVDGLVLLEPAIEVPPLTRTALCVAKLFGDTPMDFPRLTRFFGADPCKVPGASLSMGCEVTKLRDFMLDQYLTFYQQDQENGRVSRDQLSRELGELISAPTLLIHNPDDKVVRPQAAESLYRGISQTTVPALKVDLGEGKVHGNVTIRDEKLVADAITQFLLTKLNLDPAVAEQVRGRSATRSEVQAREREETYRRVEEDNRRRREWQNRPETETDAWE